MIEKIRKIYLNKKLFISVSALTLLCYIASAIMSVVNNNEGTDFRWIMLGLTVLLVWAFFSGLVNVQKVLFGAVLIAMVEVQCELLKYNSEMGAKAGTIMGIINLILSIVVFISHMYQQMDHKGKNLSIVLNQSLAITAILFLISFITSTIEAPTSFGSNIFVLGYVFNCIMIICMETRVATYKQIRDKANSEGTWTEEKKQEAKKLFKL